MIEEKVILTIGKVIRVVKQFGERPIYLLFYF